MTLLRRGEAQQAVDALRPLVFPDSPFQMSDQAPLAIRVNFIVGLLLLEQISGAEAHLNQLGHTDDQRVGELR